MNMQSLVEKVLELSFAYFAMQLGYVIEKLEFFFFCSHHQIFHEYVMQLIALSH